MAGLKGKKGGMTGSENPIVDPRFLLLCLSILSLYFGHENISNSYGHFRSMAVPWVCR